MLNRSVQGSSSPLVPLSFPYTPGGSSRGNSTAPLERGRVVEWERSIRPKFISRCFPINTLFVVILMTAAKAIFLQYEHFDSVPHYHHRCMKAVSQGGKESLCVDAHPCKHVTMVQLRAHQEKNAPQRQKLRQTNSFGEPYEGSAWHVILPPFVEASEMDFGAENPEGSYSWNSGRKR